MAIAPLCDACSTELIEFGALLFGPPDECGMTHKAHVCRRCYEQLREAWARVREDYRRAVTR